MSQENTQEFTGWRAFLWPVHSFEVKKVLPMFLMFFCISFNYTILRDTKDTLIVTGSGAETIPYLKFWCVVPAAIIFMLIFAKLSNILSKERLFYTALSPFVIFFALFPTVIYPNRDFLHPTASADFLQAHLPLGLSGLIGCYRNWTYSAFYILAELWGSAALSLLFWGFANDIMRVSEAKRFYTLLPLGANLALMFSGPTIVYFSDIRKLLPAGVDAWQVTLNYLMAIVVFMALSIIGLYWWMQRSVLTDPKLYDPKDVKKKQEKPTMSLKESFSFLAQSKYIRCIAMLVIAYGIAINLIEVPWKGRLKMQYPNPNDYSTFMGKFSFCTGVVSITLAFLGGYIIRRKGWGFAAMITPAVLLLTGTIFFSFILFENQLSGFAALFGATPLMLAVLIGAVQNILSKSTKYTLFDPTKEMAYVPLDQESKVKGKAAIDVVGARLGKSGGSLILQGLFFFGTLSTITPYLAIIVTAVIVGWTLPVLSLNRQFIAKTTKQPLPEEGAKQPQEAVVSATS